ncbi:MAG: nucleoside hydrolase [Solobacterium sp.]|nr:nucleoside hydrolase [Solobacterium sp.]
MTVINHGVPVTFPALTDEERERKTLIPAGKVNIVIDSDTKNEVDDQYAIAWAAKEKERLNLLAVYAAPFSHDCIKQYLAMPGGAVEGAGVTYAEKPGDGMELSYEEILKLFAMLGEDPEGRVFRGSDAYIKDAGGAVDSEAARDLIKRAHACEDTLYVLSIGAITNVASAIMMDPEIIKKICVVWLGGQPLHYGHGIEFNLMQDVPAANVIFESGVPLIYIPCMSVASLLTLTEDEIRTHLTGKNELTTYLGDNCLNAFAAPEVSSMMNMFLRNLYLKGRDDQPMDYLGAFKSVKASNSRIIWDISTVATVFNPSWQCSKLVHAPVVNDDLSYAEKRLEHKIREVNYLFRDYIFGEMFHALTEK